MSRSIRGFRWAAGLLAGAAATMLVSGCGAGQIAETAKKRPSVPGLNVVTPDGRYKIRNLYVAFNSPKGYPAGANAPVVVALGNDTDKPVTVTISTSDANSVVLTSGSASPAVSTSVSGTPSAPSTSATGTPSGPSASTTGTPSASASGTASPSPGESQSGQPGLSLTPPPAGEPARIQIPAHDLVVLNSRSDRQLQIIGLKAPLQTGQAINLVFTFDGQQVPVQAPVATPLTPVPPASPVVEGHAG